MSEKKTTAKRSSAAKRDASTVIANFLNINGLRVSLGDVRKSEFSAIEDPPASVKGLASWAAQINAILRGDS